MVGHYVERASCSHHRNGDGHGGEVTYMYVGSMSRVCVRCPGGSDLAATQEGSPDRQSW